MPHNIMTVDNITVLHPAVKNIDALAISFKLKRRPAYVQSYCILQCTSMSPRIKIYQVARMLGLDYYQAMKRVLELSKKGFLRLANGSMTVTNEGMVLKEILAQVIVLMHSSEATTQKLGVKVP